MWCDSELQTRTQNTEQLTLCPCLSGLYSWISGRLIASRSRQHLIKCAEKKFAARLTDCLSTDSLYAHGILFISKTNEKMRNWQTMGSASFHLSLWRCSFFAYRSQHEWTYVCTGNDWERVVWYPGTALLYRKIFVAARSAHLFGTELRIKWIVVHLLLSLQTQLDGQSLSWSCSGFILKRGYLRYLGFRYFSRYIIHITTTW